MIIPFDAELRPDIELGNLGVVTAQGKKVEIVKWDCKGDFPILAAIDTEDGCDSEFYNFKGEGCSGDANYYLKLDDFNPEMTDFEKELAEAVVDWETALETDVRLWAKYRGAKLMALAREEIEGKKGMQAVPMWKKANAGRKLPGDCLIKCADDDPRIARLGQVAINDCYYIELSELMELPKES